MNLICYLFFSILFHKILNYNCSLANPDNNCFLDGTSDDDKNNYYHKLPLFAGRCCKNNTYNECYYINEEHMNPDYWKENEIKCFTNIEICNDKTVKNKNYTECTNFPVEPPYLCCYIGSKKYHECKAIPVNDKKIYKQTESWARNKYKDYDGDFEIICNQFYLKIQKIFLLLFLILL
jgi:hypothetical protein